MPSPPILDLLTSEHFDAQMAIALLCKIINGKDGCTELVETIVSGKSMQTLLGIGEPPTIDPDKAATLAAGVDSALGYVFSNVYSNVPLALSTAEVLFSALQMYSVLLRELCGRASISVGMSCVIVGLGIDPNSPKIHFGSAVMATENATLQMDKIQKLRRDLLVEALAGPGIRKDLPPLPPNVEFEAVKALKNIYLTSDSLSGPEDSEREGRKTALDDLEAWRGELTSLHNPKKRQDDRWPHEQYLAWLYLQLLRALVGDSNGTKPLQLYRRRDMVAYEAWRIILVNFLLNPEPPKTFRRAERNSRGDTWDTAWTPPAWIPRNTKVYIYHTGEMKQEFGWIHARECLMQLFHEDRVFLWIKNRASAIAGVAKYGHCAETYPVIEHLKLLANGDYNRHTGKYQGRMVVYEGLAAVLNETETLLPSETGEQADLRINNLELAYPCRNCRALLKIAGMPEARYNHYLNENKTKNRREPTLLDEYVVGAQVEWPPIPATDGTNFYVWV